MKGKPVLTVVCSENKRKCGYLFTAIHRVPARLHEKRSHHATNTLITVWCWVPWRQMKNVWELSCVQIVLCGLPLFRWLFVVCRGSGEQVWQCCFFFFQTPPVLARCRLLVKSLTRVVFYLFEHLLFVSTGTKAFKASLTKLSFYICNLEFFYFDHYLISTTEVAVF